MGILQDLRADHQKDGMFDEIDMGVSYALGIPILDQLLGFIQDIQLPDGTIHRQYRPGVPAGTMTMFAGPPSSGKTTIAYQAGWNIIQPFGTTSSMTIFNAEEMDNTQRVLDVLGITPAEYREQIVTKNCMENNTFEFVLDYLMEIVNKKQKYPNLYMYDTGFYNIHGEPIRYYTPDVAILDSLMKFVPKNQITEEELKKQHGLTISGRNAIERGEWLSKVISLARKYNINILAINHLSNALQLTPGSRGFKQLVYIPTGKNLPGGDKVLYYTSSIIAMQPIGNKDTLKTEEENGYNGVPVKCAISKSRTGPGGYTATLELIQESGFDIRMTLLHFARENDMILGRNPKCYFEGQEDVRFDTRIMVKEFAENPDLMPALFAACRPKLMSLIREPIDPKDPVKGSEVKRQAAELLRAYYNQ